MNEFNTDLQYSLDIRRNEDFNQFYYKIWPVKLIEGMDWNKNKREQTTGIDKKIHLKTGKVVSVEEKCRRKDYGDIFLEVYSNVSTKKLGWIYTCQSEYLMYYIEPNRKVYLLPVELLKLAYLHNMYEWAKRYPVREAPNKGYQSKGICVPAAVIQEAINEEMIKNY